MSGWLDVRDAEPELDGEDYGYRIQSREVLVTDGRRVYVATLSRYRDDDFGPGLTSQRDWHLSGRDFYSLEGVTHWQPLPSLPEPPAPRDEDGPNRETLRMLRRRERGELS